MEKINQWECIIEVFPEGENIHVEDWVWEDDRHRTYDFSYKDWRIRVKDSFQQEGSGVRLGRMISGTYRGSGPEGRAHRGIRIGLRVPAGDCRGKKRICIPSMIYTEEHIPEGRQKHTFMEDRLTDPMVLIWESDTGRWTQFAKEEPYKNTEKPIREKGDSKYLHKTDNTSIGYLADPDQGIWFESFWPYSEEDHSPAINSEETPVTAYWPLDGEEFNICLEWRIEEGMDEFFAEAVYRAYERDAGRLEAAGHKAAELPFSPAEAAGFRRQSLGKCYREFGEKGAGFFFHFDPRKGYGSRPSGFSTSYDTIPHNSYTHILEYGFTGRQINAAYIMASREGGEWLDRGERVIDFFLTNCQLENGWVYSLYDLEKAAPFFSFGDPDAPKLHYISRTMKKGNYLRTMTEPMLDLLECWQWYESQGRVHPEWKEAVRKYADFLVEVQNEDGSWYRAYCPDGEGTDSIDRQDQGDQTERGQKAVTSIPLIFLSSLGRALEDEGEDSAAYRESAVRAGEYVMEHMVEKAHYQGATLDNPNAVDKEAAQYAMAGLYHLYKLTGEEKYLSGAEQAAYLFVTWNYIWNAPMQKGTILCEKDFKTKGMGAINSVWGGGVVDIYSLFHLRELYAVGREKNHRLMCSLADWAAHAACQILSWPGDDMGFTDIGMQPEGFGICPQGADEGMIHKGDIWGTLGWIYSAGIYGSDKYLKEKEDM